MSIRTLIKNVFVYGGHQGGLAGPYATSVDKELSMFHKINAWQERAWEIQKISGEALAHTLHQTSPTESLLVIPAGESSSLDDAFSDETLDAIRSKTDQGLRLYATCGSAYWLAKTRAWSQEATTLRKEGRANLFHGTAVGPLSPYPGEPSPTAFFHQAAPLKTARSRVTVLLSGGGAFFPDPQSKQEVQTLATYADETLRLHGKTGEWAKAVIAFRYGLGKAILSMVHPDYGPEDIQVDAYKRAFPHRKDPWPDIRNALSSERTRLSFVAETLEAFE